MNIKRFSAIMTVTFLVLALLVLLSTMPNRKTSLLSTYCADKPAATQLWAEVRCP